MTTLTAVREQQITPAPVVPVNLDPSSARVHARRVRDLMREVSAATRVAESREREGFADLLALGIALSQAVDLGIIGTPGALNWREVWPHAFPTGRTNRSGGCRFREAIRLDRGGILAAVFDEYDMDTTYQYVNPKWEPQLGLPEAIPMGRPKLALVVGGVR